MKQNGKIIAYYKKRLYGGRATLARAIDFIALRLITLAACYLWFTSALQNTVMAFILSVTTLVTVSLAAELYKSTRLDRFIVREKARVREGMLLGHLYMTPREDFLKLVQSRVRAAPETYGAFCLVYPLQQATPANADTVLSVYKAARKKGCTEAVIFSVSGASPEAEAFLEQCVDISVRFEPVSSLFEEAEAQKLLPDDAAVSARILKTIEDERKKRRTLRKNPFQAGRVKRYVLVALALFAASFFVKHTLYYRLLSAACVSFGAIAWWTNNLAAHKKQQNN